MRNPREQGGREGKQDQEGDKEIVAMSPMFDIHSDVLCQVISI
jgi:hypothetical protein